MSLAIFYHDRERALVCSDDREVSYETGAPTPRPYRVAKFHFLDGGIIFAALGPGLVCRNFTTIAASLAKLNPGVTLADLVHALPQILPERWARRAPDPKLPPSGDAAETALVGYDATEKRVRSFVFASYENFKPIEITRDPNARIFALGAYARSDWPLLDALTKRMTYAHERDLAWVAGQLRQTVAEFRRRDPRRIGRPSFYGALDRTGRVALPCEYPPPEILASAEAAESVAAHRVTTTKETAFAGTNRFFLGSITTPPAGGSPTTGNNDGGNGAQGGAVINLWPQTYNAYESPSSPSAVNNPLNCIGGDSSEYTQFLGEGSENGAIYNYYGFPPLSGKALSMTLCVDYEVVTNNLNGSDFADQGWSLRYNTTEGFGGVGTFTQFAGALPGAGPVARTTATVSLPVTLNPYFVVVSALVQTYNSTAGSVDFRIHAMWIEVVQ